MAAESIQKTDPYIRNILDTTNQTVDQTGKNKIHWGHVKFRVKSSMECYSIILKSLSICITFSTWSDAIGQCISPIKWESDNWSHKVSLHSLAWGFWKKISKSIKNWGDLSNFFFTATLGGWKIVCLIGFASHLIWGL